jgi:hypothetical protein
MKPALALTIGLLVLMLLSSNRSTWYYGQLITRSASPLRMAGEALLFIGLVLLAGWAQKKWGEQ